MPSRRVEYDEYDDWSSLSDALIEGDPRNTSSRDIVSFLPGEPGWMQGRQTIDFASLELFIRA